MAKRQFHLLILITAIFVAFTLGFFTGRNYNSAPVQIQKLNPEPSEKSDLILQAPETTAPPTESQTSEPPETEVPEERPLQLLRASLWAIPMCMAAPV